MKKIIFVRHGKAEEEGPEFSDFERSLTPGGKRISRSMARIFSGKEKTPGLMISSPAFRALETALIFAGECRTGYDNILLNSNLYYKTDLEKVLDIVSETSNEINTITFFGHNPSFSDIADSLCREGCDFMPKTGVACISFNVSSWSEIRRKTGKLEYLLKPEKLL